VIKHRHHTCADCDDYTCERLIRMLGVEEGLDSFISHKPAIPNLERIREVGLEVCLDELRERRLLAERLLDGYNEGRSMTFYCTACALMTPEMIRISLDEVEGMLSSEQLDGADIKAKAKAMRSAIQIRANRADIDLKLRKKK
jgi:hypothetical protein